MTPEILIITRNYPPKVGGLEKYSFALIEAFSSLMKTHRITLSKSKRHLLWFLPFSLIKALFIVNKHSIPKIHLCDGLLAPVGLILKMLTGAEVSVTIHGLDITYDNRLYRKFIPSCVAKLDRIVCVSHATLGELLKRAPVLPENCIVIPNGIQRDEMYLADPRRELERRFEQLTRLNLSNRKVILTLGHLVKRKGARWFVSRVMPELPEEYLYLVAGEGPERDAIEKAVMDYDLKHRVFLLGEISHECRTLSYNLADILVMPNITVPRDVEGFGIVAIEAGTCGLPVVASNVQGIRDAVIDGQTGYLVGEKNVAGFIRRITEMDLEKEKIRNIVNEAFNWEKLSEKYRRFLFA